MRGNIEDIRVYNIRNKYQIKDLNIKKNNSLKTLCNIKIRIDFPLFLTETIRPYYNRLNLYYKYLYIHLFVI